MLNQEEREKSILKDERDSHNRNKWRGIYALVVGTLLLIMVGLYFFTIYFK